MRFIRSGFHRSIPVIALASVVALTFSQAGCASAPKQSMESSAANTSGQGTVEAKAGPNDNTQIEVRVKHLSDPARVASDASVYVVWIQPRNGEIQNVGALRLDDDLVGSLNTTTPHRTFTLTVTPEPSARMAVPTHRAVFTTEVNRAD
ncbi:MAG: hypothetical protein H6Q88_1445 [Anaeromyxobacteraceae bacterium]|jgi:FlaG/FlaF family flagellin (archaellin)|nr:hypothetical protein [Anaeromyxobacteraceae bacterium]